MLACKSNEIYVRICFRLFCKTTNLLVFNFQGLRVGTDKMSEMTILGSIDLCIGFIFRNKVRFHVRRFGRARMGQTFWAG